MTGDQSIDATGAAGDVHITVYRDFTNHGAASFGGGRAEGPDVPRTRSGRVDPAELAAIRAGYVERPLDRHLQATLAADHLVLLAGRPGWGRRWAALRSLAAVAGDRVHVLDATRLKPLLDADYRAGEGYFYDASASSWNDEEWSEARIRRLRDQVGAAEAFLVALLPSGPDRSDLPCGLRWERIANAELLRAAGFDPPLPDGEEVVDRLVGASAPVGEVARLIAHLRRGQEEGVSFDDAIADHPGSRRSEIQERVEAITDRGAAAMMVCLCFLGGTSETAFDAGHLDLLAALGAADSEPSPTEDYGPRTGLLAGCDGEQTCALRTVGEVQVEVPVIDFNVPALAPLYVEEFWRGRPGKLRREVVLWLRRFVPTLRGADLVAAAERVALLAGVDFGLLVAELLAPWADEGHEGAHVAAGVLEILGAQGRSAEAVLVASDWATAPLGTTRMLAATYFFAAVATDHPENALKVARKGMRGSRQGPTRWVAEQGWRGLAAAAATDEGLATTVTTFFARHDALRRGDLADGVFAMLDVWFAGDRRTKPLAMRTAALGPTCEAAVVEVLTAVTAKTHDRLHWYRPLVGYLTVGSTSAVAERLIDESVRRLPPARRRYVVEVLLNLVWRWHRQKDGPSRLATEKADDIIRRHDPRRSS